MNQRPPRKKRDPSEIGDALRNVGDEFVKRNPADIRALRLSLAKARRKRQLFFGGSVVAATAAIALLFVVAQRPGTNTRPVDVAEQPASSQTLRITSEITLDGQPFQVASNSEGAYVTLRDEGAVAKIDPEGKVQWIQTIGGAPEDIIAGEFAVWVTEPEAREIHALSFRRGVATQTPISVTKGIPQRLSVGATSVRISTLDGPAYRINFDGREGQQLGSDTAWDIAYAAGRLWILTPEGLVYPIDAESGIPVEGFEPVSVFEAGEFELATAGEITAAHGGIWYGRPGDASLLRIDEGDGSTEEIALPDSYLDLDGDSQGGLWILTSSGDAGELIEVDDKTGELLPRSIALHDAPVDIAASGDGVWIVLAGSHEVLHVNDAVEGTL